MYCTVPQIKFEKKKPGKKSVRIRKTQSERQTDRQTDRKTENRQTDTIKARTHDTHHDNQSSSTRGHKQQKRTDTTDGLRKKLDSDTHTT